MPSEDIPSAGSQPSSDEANRKLWFEYLAKLNERELQSARATGFTPWALVAVAAAIVYSAIPKIPSFLATSRAVTTSLAVLLLEINVVFFVGFFVILLIAYCAPQPHSRLPTQHSKRSAALRLFVARFGLAVFAIAHFIAFATLAGFSSFRWILVVFGLWWLYNLLIGSWQEFKNAREAKKLDLPPIEFTVTSAVTVMASPIGAAVVFVFGVVPLVSLILFLRALHHAVVSWVIPLGAATDVLVLVAVLVILFSMGVASASRGVFLALERDVILENLSASEIKTRFIREVLGPSVGDWLGAVHQKLRESFQVLVRVGDSLKPRVEAIEAIDTQFPLERAGRAQKLLDELDAAISSYSGEVDKFKHQILQLRKVTPITFETEILKGVVDQLVADAKQMVGAASSIGQLKKRLRDHLNAPK